MLRSIRTSLVVTPLFLVCQVFAQQASPTYIVRGRVTDGLTGESVIGASVYLPGAKQGATTNSNGDYRVWIKAGGNVIQVSSVGYATVTVAATISQDTVINHVLMPQTESLDEVVIYGDADPLNNLKLGQNSLNLVTLKKMPSLLGEVDIVRGLLLMPGVSTVGEGATGFNVRGGSVDQNLILLDDAPIFNASHLFGFLTAFNSNAVNHAELYKGSIPVNYGGRIASVLDVKLKQGNSNKFSSHGGLGLMSANLTLEGPIISGRTTAIASGRISYSDWLLKTIPEDGIKNSDASFYDVILKVTHQLAKNHLLSFTGYRSYDSFKFPGDTTYSWGSQNFTLKLGSTLSDRVFLMTTLVSSDYAYKVLGREQTNEFDWKAGIGFLNARFDGTITLNQKHKTEIGAGIERYEVGLGTLEPLNNSNINSFFMDSEVGLVTFGYLSHQVDFNRKLSLRLGVRASMFGLYGPGSVNQYQEGGPKSEDTFTGTSAFNGGESIARYGGFEPRASLRIALSPSSTLKAGFDQTIQYLHLISNTSAVSPVDLWKLSDTYLRPQRGTQYSIGYFRSRNIFQFSLEGFFKQIENIVDYKDGAELLLNDRLEADLLQGAGRSYGAELLVEKKSGRLTGWVSYTLSRTERKIVSVFDEETVNDGEYYPANYDKPHNIAITGSYEKNKRVSFGFNFVLASGRPVTYPTAGYVWGDVKLANFNLRNNERSPAYHRLDVSMEIRSKVKAGRKWSGAWNISLYNVYARKNPYSIFFTARNLKVAQPYRLAVIGTIVPSLSYSITF